MKALGTILSTEELSSQALCIPSTSAIPAGRQRQEDCEFKASLGHIGDPFSKNQNKNHLMRRQDQKFKVILGKLGRSYHKIRKALVVVCLGSMHEALGLISGTTLKTMSLQLGI